MSSEVAARGPQALVDDYERAFALWPESTSSRREERESISLLRDTIILCAHILGRDADQLAGQLLGRLEANDNRRLRELLGRARSRDGGPWLRPVRATLTPPGPLLRTLRTEDDVVNSLTVSGDGRFAVSAGEAC